MTYLADSPFCTAAIVVLAGCLVWLTKRWGAFPSKDPEKSARWRVLPFRFKFACWFGVTPLFILSVVLGVLLSGWAYLLALLVLVAAWASMLLLEIRIVAWYRKNDYLSAKKM